jgi:hypothetical protein
VVVVVVGMVAVVVENCTHVGFLLNTFLNAVLDYLRAVLTSAGCTSWPVLLDQLFLV